MICIKNKPRESSSTSDSSSSPSSSKFKLAGSVVVFLAGFLVTLVLVRAGLAGLSCGFFFQKEESTCWGQKDHKWAILMKVWLNNYTTLTAGSLLKVQKVLSPVLLQSAQDSFSNALVASVISASDNWMSQWHWGSFRSPVYSQIKPGRRLSSKIL